MADLTIANWFGDLISHPQAVAEAASAVDVVNVLQNPARYPSPVRAVGSNHSPGACAVVTGGTILKMAAMNRILEITNDTVTAEAGALYIDVAKALEARNLQFYVNTEIGNLTVGSAACCGTKDSAMPGEFGQVGSYVTRIKMALPSGEFLEVTEAQPELMQQVRSSYGTFGIVCEATFRVRPIEPMSVHHQTFRLADFVAGLPALKAGGESLMFYVFPFDDLVTVEFRKYNPGAKGDPNRAIWPLRNYLWAGAGPLVCANAERDIADKTVRYQVIDGFNAMWRWKLENLIQSENTIAADQIIRYPPVGGASRYTFSLWAFPEETYPATLKACFQFCQDYYRQNGYRINMLFVGYRVAKDQSSLLSYSYDGDVMTIDPVSTGNPGWNEFLVAYNAFCSDQGGIPLFNQTYGITRAQAQKALGDRLKTFAAARQVYDPKDRLLNDYFRDILAE
ncbi:MAG TPA: FAD-binding oxidoreductase [Bryobacteraceae bacterium]|nr:FAD-binding oxidoreductase [Bryobacteraceae bacterium]